VPGHRFLDGGNQMQDLAFAPAQRGIYGRTLASDGLFPYAFVTSSGS
jgi:hypothetical protein